MRYKVSNLKGALLDAAVAKAEGYAFELGVEDYPPRRPVCYVRDQLFEGLHDSSAFDPSAEWHFGGKIIERERITIEAYHKPHKGASANDGWPKNSSGKWLASLRWIVADDGYQEGGGEFGDTPLIAAMRAYVASKFGEEVELGA